MSFTKVISLSTWKAAVCVLVALALPVWLAAQEEQHKQKDLPRYTVQDLGTLGGTFSLAGGINNKGEVVGPSFSAPGPTSGSPRAFLWRNGIMHDLNALVPPDSPLYLLVAYGINDSGEIAGFGVSVGVILALAPVYISRIAVTWSREECVNVERMTIHNGPSHPLQPICRSWPEPSRPESLLR